MVKIVTDSSTLYSSKEGLEKGIYVIPLNITIANRSYKDYDEISDISLFNMIKEGKIPHTSQPSIGEKIDIYNKLGKDNEVIDITMAKGLSGTYDSALIAKKNCDYPDKIHVVNSYTLCGSHRYIVDKAKQMADEGKSVSEICDMINKYKDKEISFLIPIDFNYLERGGRVKGFTALIGGLLKLVPVLKKSDDGTVLEKYHIARTVKKATSEVIEGLINKHVDDTYHIFISHANNIELAQNITDKIKETIKGASIAIYNLSPSFITQGGPGCVSVQAIKAF